MLCTFFRCNKVEGIVASPSNRNFVIHLHLWPSVPYEKKCKRGTHLLLGIELGLPPSLSEEARCRLGLVGVVGELQVEEGVLEAVRGSHSPRRHRGLRRQPRSRNPRRSRAGNSASCLFVVDESKHLGQSPEKGDVKESTS